MGDPAERRRSPRLRIAACAAIETIGGRTTNDQALCTVRDVSRNGIGLETGQPPRMGQVVQLRIAIEDEIVEISARMTRVGRVDDSSFYRIGLDWMPGTEGQRRFLERVFEVAETLSF